MRFRTEIEKPVAGIGITHSMPLLMLGSCFTDEIGERLVRDGFHVVRNPLGPLYNPLSLSNVIVRALGAKPYGPDDLISDSDGVFHCLDYASRYRSEDPVALAETVNADIGIIRDMLAQMPVVIITLGSAFVYEYINNGRAVGNCHKLPSCDFIRRRLDARESAEALAHAVGMLRDNGCPHVILTISPIRHLADGLPGNSLSKATLRVAAESLREMFDQYIDYFPSFEIMLDDLRDYRFYAADMKHPSETAVDYIYSVFESSYFDKSTLSEALEHRKRSRHEAHRTIITT